MTIQGLQWTTLRFIIGLWVYPGREINYKEQKGFFIAWKWFAVITQILLIIELIVTAYFWAVLYPFSAFKVDFRATIDHSVPIALLFIDFVLFQAQPMFFKWIYASLLWGILYLCINASVRFRFDKPIYPGMTFDSVAGFTLPIIVLIFNIIF